MVDFNRDGQIDIGEAAATLGFVLYFKQAAKHARNRRLAAMSEHDRAWHLANEWLVDRCRTRFGMRRREINAVARLMTHISQSRQLYPWEACQWWLDEGEHYWYQGGGKERWHR